jgi:hypothetical protein
MVGVIRTARSTVEPTGVKLTLVCRETRGSGDSRSTQDVFTKEYDPPQQSVEEDGRMLVPVVVDIPTGYGPTSEKANRKWILRVKAKAVPVALKAEFELPVFDTEEGEVLRRKG